MVTLKPVHSLVAEVMAGVGTPLLIVEGAASPHTFTLKPSAAKAIHEADVFIRVSPHVEPFTRKIAESLPPSVKIVTLSDIAGMTLLDQRHGGAFEKHEHDGAEAGHAEHDDAPHERKDGHIWLDPENAKLIVASVARVLAEAYPAEADRLRANAAGVAANIDKLAAEIQVEIEPAKTKPFVVFHDATQYFENRFGLAAIGSITVSPDVQPSAKRLTQVRKKIAELGAVCVFTEPAFQPNLVTAVTEGTKARSGALDAEGQMLTPGPGLYFKLMRDLARNLKGCLSPAG